MAASLTTETLSFTRTSIGRKVLMAVSGIILVGFVIGHLLGNLQIYLGPDALNTYARFLHANPGLVWSVRLLLLAALAVHVIGYVQTALQSLRARGTRYQVAQRYSAASFGSRSMRYTGPLILAYVFYHLAHLTLGTAHPRFDEQDVYRNVLIGFSSPVPSLVYIAAMTALGLHLVHGVWSMFQTLGLNSFRWSERLRRFSAALTALIVLGNISIPVAVLTGLIR